MHRISCFFLLAVMVVSGTGPSARSADDIIARYVKKVGGVERIQAVRTLRRTGRFYGGGGFETTVNQENKRPHQGRLQISLHGITALHAYDGKSDWKVGPFAGKKGAAASGE